MVLLDYLVRQQEYELVVAHFDHGIREDSACDARFVEALANKYNLPFWSKREELGVRASEELAREKRYGFLFNLSRQLGATIATAHHSDDVVETIALNLERGTRWRGLSVMGNQDVFRPLIGWSKEQIYHYAAKNRLEWVEDYTNHSDRYRRNQLRRRIRVNLTTARRQEILALWQKQTWLRRNIEQDFLELENKLASRYFLIQIDNRVAVELLYQLVKRKIGVSLLSSQLENMLIFIKTGKPNTAWRLAKNVEMKLSLADVIINRVD